MTKNALECAMCAGYLVHCLQGLERDVSHQTPVRMTREALVAHAPRVVNETITARELFALVKQGIIERRGVPGTSQYTC